MALTWLIAAILAFPAGFTEAPAYVPLFAPRGVPPGTYRTFTSPQGLPAAVAALGADTAAAPGAFVPALEAPADAFGQSGGYNRWQLALLYGGRRVTVARGPRVESGHVVEAWTLISPYPDSSLTRLNSGTLLIVLRLGR